jgi:hypothetical protein
MPISGTVLPMLHPLLAPGVFDLPALLEHDPPTPWHPDVGERLQAQVVAVRDVRAFGTSATTLFMLTDEGRYLTVRCGGVVLKGAVRQLRPAPGDQVVLLFEGMRPTRDGTRQYGLTRMALRRDGRWVSAR